MVAKTQPSTSATQSMGPAVTTPSRGGKGSRAHVLKAKEPAPGSLKGKEPAPAAARKSKEPAPAAARKSKKPALAAARKSKKPAPAAARKTNDPAPAAARRTKEPAPAGRRGKGPGAGTLTEPQPPTMVVQPSEAAGDGLELPPTSSSSTTTTCVQPSEAAEDGLELPPTSSSFTTTTTSGQPSEAAEDGLEPPPHQWLCSPLSSLPLLGFVVEQNVEEHGEDMQLGLHGGVVVPCVSNGRLMEGNGEIVSAGETWVGFVNLVRFVEWGQVLEWDRKEE
ncbi:hypothetical protein NDU88_005727 [Pleurodeles waltl]|uniref:Uncharacterized protein n=1 Tax=Pleurodeles waltl TaxID=8319 RepID=A0AAV7TDG4_PLEWA|nr:hypothetical protein NDU88_005727 [Pleurodeles waltl]